MVAGRKRARSKSFLLLLLLLLFLLSPFRSAAAPRAAPSCSPPIFSRSTSRRRTTRRSCEQRQRKQPKRKRNSEGSPLLAPPRAASRPFWTRDGGPCTPKPRTRSPAGRWPRRWRCLWPWRAGRWRGKRGRRRERRKRERKRRKRRRTILLRLLLLLLRWRSSRCPRTSPRRRSLWARAGDEGAGEGAGCLCRQRVEGK